MKRVLALLAVSLLASMNAWAEPDNPDEGKKDDPTAEAKNAKPHPTQDPGIRKLTRRERKDAIRNLEQTYRDWLDKVGPIITPDEVNAFLVLESNAQRDLNCNEFHGEQGKRSTLPG